MKKLLYLSLALSFLSLGSPIKAQEFSDIDAPAVRSAPQMQEIQTGPLTLVPQTNVRDVIAKVESVDHTNRIITLRGEAGNLRTLRVNPNVNISKVKKGDVVHTQFYDRVAASIKKNEPKKAPMIETKKTVLSAKGPKGLPIQVETQEVRQIADVTKVSRKKGRITLRGVRGNSIQVSVNPNRLIGVKSGDQVEINYTESVAIALTKK